MIKEFSEAIAKLFENPVSLLIVLGGLLVAVAAAGGITYNNFFPIPHPGQQVLLGAFGFALALAGVVLAQRQARRTPPLGGGGQVDHGFQLRSRSRSNVLWVDDKNPDRNLQERNSLEARGVDFTLATTTEEAFEKTQRQFFDAIVSDMGRSGDPEAGFTLLEKLRAVGNETPFIIYTGSKAAQLWRQAREKGALGCTNSPGELSGLVLSAIRRSK
jgi:CheY-like chemotaxis protein